MSSRTEELTKKGLISPPKFLLNNVHYETMTGSVAYGVSGDTSDMDLCGFCIPSKDMIFPHLRGEIRGFGTEKKLWGEFQKHHIEDASAMGGKGRNYDITIFSIIKFFNLCMQSNPNMIDVLFTPETCIQHCSSIGTMVREKRHIFLHKGCWARFKGYAFQQLHKMNNKKPEKGSKRAELVEKFGYDTKYAYHLVRLLDEVEQILETGTLDLQRAKEHMKAVRRGEVTEEEIRQHFATKKDALEKLYEKSSLRKEPNETEIKELLLNCLEEHYGDLSSVIVNPDAATVALDEIQGILEKYNGSTEVSK